MQKKTVLTAVAFLCYVFTGCDDVAAEVSSSGGVGYSSAVDSLGVRSSSVHISSSSSISGKSSAGGMSSSILVSYGSMTDSRDGQVYKTVEVGTQIWMAQNLNYVPASQLGYGAWCYNLSSDSCLKYGRLYNWSAAMSGSASSAAVPSGVRGLCPSGWHLPSDGEWTILANVLGGAQLAGKKLKSDIWAGDNSSGFSALPAGGRNYYGIYYDIGDYAHFWSATEKDSSYAWYRFLESGSGVFSRDYGYNKNFGFSIRCLKD